MDRKHFIRTLAALPLAGAAMELRGLETLALSFPKTPRMPVLFLGHGSPMNAIEENEFVAGFRKVGTEVPHPSAVLVVSAHWETRGTRVTAMAMPRTIHDFGGFPQALFDVQYPAPGSPELAAETKALITEKDITLDHQWGLDHGAWSVVKHMYPKADVPVVQLSIDYTMSPEQHYALGQRLASLRHRGVLIVGSGNMVHNLRMVAWDRLNDPEFGFDWALEARAKMNEFILKGDHRSLVNFRQQGRAFDLAIPSVEHYLPMLYAVSLQEKDERAILFNDKPVGGSLSMTSVKLVKA